MLKLFIILCFIFNIHCYKCPKDVCGIYQKYSQCWYGRMYHFDYCMVYVNINKKKSYYYINNCIDYYANKYRSGISVNSSYTQDLSFFNICNNTSNDVIKKEKLYVEFLKVGECFYKYRSKINKTGKDTNGNIVNCFNLPKYKDDTSF